MSGEDSGDINFSRMDKYDNNKNYDLEEILNITDTPKIFSSSKEN